jgi:hypothetical protein
LGKKEEDRKTKQEDPNGLHIREDQRAKKLEDDLTQNYDLSECWTINMICL